MLIERGWTSCSAIDGVKALIAYTAREYPDAAWAGLKEIDFEQDLQGTRSWLADLLAAEPLPKEVKGLWFGVYNPIVDGEMSCGFYLTGPTTEFNREEHDWACWTDETYIPEGRYAPSAALHTLYRATHRMHEFDVVTEYLLCLGYVCLAARDALQHLDLLPQPCDLMKMPVVVGFDEGDYIVIGRIGSAGWEVG